MNENEGRQANEVEAQAASDADYDRRQMLSTVWTELVKIISSAPDLTKKYVEGEVNQTAGEGQKRLEEAKQIAAKRLAVDRVSKAKSKQIELQACDERLRANVATLKEIQAMDDGPEKQLAFVAFISANPAIAAMIEKFQENQEALKAVFGFMAAPAPERIESEKS